MSKTEVEIRHKDLARFLLRFSVIWVARGMYKDASLALLGAGYSLLRHRFDREKVVAMVELESEQMEDASLVKKTASGKEMFDQFEACPVTLLGCRRSFER